MAENIGMPGPILQDEVPEDQRAAAADPIPRLRPVGGPWLTVDGAYAAQVAERRRLLAEARKSVLVPPDDRAAAALHAALSAALDAHPDMRCVLCLFEGGVTGAADGYWRMARNPAANVRPMEL